MESPKAALDHLQKSPFTASLLERQTSEGSLRDEDNRIQDSGKLTGYGLFSNLFLSIIGTAVLGISSQMRRAGWIFTPVLLVVGCAVIVEMTFLVSTTIDRMLSQGIVQSVVAYPDYARGAFGHWGVIITSFTSGLSLIGMICAGLIIEAQNMQELVPLSFGCDTCGSKWWALLLSSTTLVYCFASPTYLLKAAAFLGPLCAGITLIMAMIGTGSAIVQSEEIPEECQSVAEIPRWYMLPEVPGQGTFGAIAAVAGVASYMFYCFACVTTVPTLKSQMIEPKKLVPAASSAYVLCSTLFLIIMFMGYAGFGNFGPDNIIQSMKIDRPVGWWALHRGWETGTISIAGQMFAWTITINLLLTDAVFIPCTISAIEQLNPQCFTSSRLRRVILRFVISGIRLLVATYVTSFVAITTLTSALFCVVDNILLPIAAFYYLRVKQVSLLRKILHALIFIFGVMVAFSGTYSAMSEIVWPSPTAVGRIGSPMPGLTDACRATYQFYVDQQ